ncbi:hypothetical protein Esti_005252 [Eimeria stiedai]
MEQQKRTILDLGRLQRQGVEQRARIVYLETEMEDAKTVVEVLKEELDRWEDSSFVTPPRLPPTYRKTPSPRVAPRASEVSFHHKMMDDASDKHLSSTELRTSGMQLLSRGTERAPQQTLTRSPKASPSCKSERGVMAIIVGHGPSMTSEYDGSLPSANSEQEQKEEKPESKQDMKIWHFATSRAQQVLNSSETVRLQSSCNKLKVPECKKYNRAFDFLGSSVIYRWHRSKANALMHLTDPPTSTEAALLAVVRELSCARTHQSWRMRLDGYQVAQSRAKHFSFCEDACLQ